jgi:uncharacterized membrane protein (UPF0127 family)
MDAQQTPDVPVVGGGDHFGSAGQDTFVVFPNGNLDIFPTDTELSIDAGPSQHHFTVELAETIQQLDLGLMFREDLAEGRGMLFDFWLEREAGFWMKNTFVSLDMFFISADGTIVNVAERTAPLSEEINASGQPVRAVLEVPAGTAETLGIGIGDRVLHPIFGTMDPSADGSGNTLPEHGGDTPRGGNDIIHDFARGEDVIDLRFFGAARVADFDTNGDGVLDNRDAPLDPVAFGVLTFAALDTSGDGVLGGGDAPVAITAAGDTVIRLPPTSDAAGAYTLTVADVTGLTAMDFLFRA